MEEKTVVVKKWYESKTMWVNAVMLVAVLVQQLSPNTFIVSTEEQTAFVIIVNMILRGLTGKSLG